MASGEKPANPEKRDTPAVDGTLYFSPLEAAAATLMDDKEASLFAGLALAAFGEKVGNQGAGHFIVTRFTGDWIDEAMDQLTVLLPIAPTSDAKNGGLIEYGEKKDNWRCPAWG
eukprot:4125468-Amphidinium_carterae.1